MKMRSIAPLFIFCLVISSGCSTVKGAASGFGQDVQAAGKGIKKVCKKLVSISGVKKIDDKFKEAAW